MRLITTIAIATLLIGLPSAASLIEPFDGPVENGSFETPFVAEEARTALEGSPVDECTGIGHQVFFGPESTPGYLLGGEATAPDPTSTDPGSAADRVTDDPAREALFQTGYGHCIDDAKGEGVDLVWFNTVDHANKPVMWSVHPRTASTAFVYDGDDDPSDREAQFIAEKSLSNHNLWQVYVSQPGLYTANFTSFDFVLEDGEIPTKANVYMHLSATPLELQTPYAAGYFECTLVLPAETMIPDGQGQISIDPLDGDLNARDPECEDAADTFSDEGNDEEVRRAALGRLRVVQMGFRNFNLGTQDVVIDDVNIQGASTAADELAGGNYNLDPQLDLDDA